MPIVLPPLPAENDDPWFEKRAAWDAAVEAKVESLPDAVAPAAHGHAAGDITSGTLALARLGTGTPDAEKFLAGDNTWKAPPAGGGGGAPFSGRHLAGRTHINAVIGGSYADNLTLGVAAWHIPFYVGVACTYSHIVQTISGGVAAGALLRVGVYNVDPATGMPGTLVRDIGTFDASTTGDKTLTIAGGLALPAGVYFTVVSCNNASVIVRRIGSEPKRNPLNWFGFASVVNMEQTVIVVPGVGTGPLASPAVIAGWGLPGQPDIPLLGLVAS